MDRKSAIMLIMVLLGMVSTIIGSSAAQTPRAQEIKLSAERRVSLNENWRFLKGDAEGAEKPEFPDTAWRVLDLPHDWAIEGPFDIKYSPHSGGLPFFGTGWYRKHFVLPAGARGRQFTIEFDGAMANSNVWINGKQLG